MNLMKCPKCKIEMEVITRNGQGYTFEQYLKCYQCGRQIDIKEDYMKNRINLEDFEKIMKDDITETVFLMDKDNALMGLKIIEKYLPQSGIEGAQHDIIYSVEAEELAKAGITIEDSRKLRELNWMIEEGCLACYV